VDTRLRASAKRLVGRRKRAAPHLHVQHQPLQPGGELLGQDAGGDQRHRLDGGGDVADGVQPPVGRRQFGGLAPTMAQPQAFNV
jgi:hypothetical protein